VAGGVDFNPGKFKEMVLFFALESQRAQDEGFGMVKLNKLLYRADTLAFRLGGKSISGETYEKQEFGPVARHLLVILDQLSAAGRLEWQRIRRGPFTRKVPMLVLSLDAHPDTRQFRPDEFEFMETALRELARHGGRSASKWSHDQSAGWNIAASYGDEISYETEFISTDPIPTQDLERARKYVRERGWVKSTA
jgi:hypothetical protein